MNQTPIIPILRDFNYSGRPIGFVDISEGHFIIKLNEKEQIRSEDIDTGNLIFAPSYMVSVEKEGIVTEVELVSFSLISPGNPRIAHP